MDWLWRGLVYIITLRWLRRDAEAAPDYNKYKSRLESEKKEYETQLVEVRKKKAQLSARLRDLEQGIRSGTLQGQQLDDQLRREALIEIRRSRREHAMLHTGEVALEKKIDQVAEDLSRIDLHDHLQPREIDPHLRQLSDRIRRRLADGEEQHDQVAVDNDLDDVISVEHDDEELRELEESLIRGAATEGDGERVSTRRPLDDHLTEDGPQLRLVEPQPEEGNKDDGESLSLPA